MLPPVRAAGYLLPLPAASPLREPASPAEPCARLVAPPWLVLCCWDDWNRGRSSASSKAGTCARAVKCEVQWERKRQSFRHDGGRSRRLPASVCCHALASGQPAHVDPRRGASIEGAVPRRTPSHASIGRCRSQWRRQEEHPLGRAAGGAGEAREGESSTSRACCVEGRVASEIPSSTRRSNARNDQRRAPPCEIKMGGAHSTQKTPAAPVKSSSFIFMAVSFGLPPRPCCRRSNGAGHSPLALLSDPRRCWSNPVDLRGPWGAAWPSPKTRNQGLFAPTSRPRALNCLWLPCQSLSRSKPAPGAGPRPGSSSLVLHPVRLLRFHSPTVDPRSRGRLRTRRPLHVCRGKDRSRPPRAP